MNEICTLFAKVSFNTDFVLDIVSKVWYTVVVPKLLRGYFMAQRWLLIEDFIICKYCLEHPWAYRIDEAVQEIMYQLAEPDRDPRSVGAVKKRAYAYEILRQGDDFSSVPEQVRAVYNEIKLRSETPTYQGVKFYISEVYNPEECPKIPSGTMDEILGKSADATHALGYQYSIKPSETFPEVLYNYLNLKGIKKYNAMCKRIGMSPDTFYSILRGRYKEVKKDNVLKLCVGLELHVDEAEKLLNSAGFTFANSIMKDVIIKSFLWNRVFSVVAINAELYENNVPMLFDHYVIEY